MGRAKTMNFHTYPANHLSSPTSSSSSRSRVLSFKLWTLFSHKDNERVDWSWTKRLRVNEYEKCSSLWCWAIAEREKKLLRSISSHCSHSATLLYSGKSGSRCNHTHLNDDNEDENEYWTNGDSSHRSERQKRFNLIAESSIVRATSRAIH